MNKNLKANELKVKSFRGISKEISLDLKDVTILYGVNGTGKSSFVNSIEYLFSGELSFLKKSTINKNKSSINKNFTKNALKIELDFNGDEYIKLSGSKKDYSSAFKDILKNTYVKNASFILNRSKLLKFIEDTQTKRYDAILDLLGIKKLNTFESNFSSTATKFRKDFHDAKKFRENKVKDLSILLVNNDNLEYSECIERVNMILQSNGEERIIPGKTDLNEFMEMLDVSSFMVIQNKLNDFYENFNHIDFLSLSLDLNKIVNDYQVIASDNLKSSQYLLSTLNSSIDYIEFTNTDICPICENNINSSEILSKLRENVSQINSSNDNFNRWKNNVNSLIFKIDSQIRYCEILHEIVKEFSLLTNMNIINFNFDILFELKQDLQEFLEFNRLASDFVDVDFNTIEKELNSIKNQFENYESRQNISELSNLFNALNKIKEITDLKKEIRTLESQFKIAEKTYNIFTKTKEEFINNLIFDIKKDIKRFYNYIHGDEDIGSPDIVLSDSKKIDVYLNSFGENVDSRSFASEGHLDTLGICIFLAFNKKFSNLPLIVLDDVLTTIDVFHKEKIAKLIVDEFSDYQFIITAHNQLWVEQLKDACAQNNSEVIVYELIGWSLDDGPLISV